MTLVKQGQVLWYPSDRFVEQSNLHRFQDWLQEGTGKSFASYEEMWQWSVAEPEAFWRAIWDSSQSGGTEFCSGLVGAVPGLAVRAGLIEAVALGVDVHVFDDDGQPVKGQPGELVVTAPMPSMPLMFWGDKDYSRYEASYFDRWPGVWRHGDLAQVNPNGGWFISGRSATMLNRFAVRIGSAEIYRTLDNVARIADSLVVCIEEANGGYYMPLFVAMWDGAKLDDATRAEIRERLKKERSPRHVPDEIIEAPGIPVTLTGKKMQVPVRKLLMGQPLGSVASEGAARDPSVLQWFAEFADRAHWRKDEDAG